MSTDVSGISKRFVSENDIEEAKRKRQEDWERVRKPDQPIEAPEEEYDRRSLFERLEEQRVKKQEEWDESHRMKNMVRGLESDEVEFLEFVARRQEQLESQRKLEEDILLDEYKSTTLPAMPAVTALASSCKANPQKALPQLRKSQKALLAGAVKRKSTDCGKVDGPKLVKLGGSNDALDGSDLATSPPAEAPEGTSAQNGSAAEAAGTDSRLAASAASGSGSVAASAAGNGAGAASTGSAVAGGPPAGGGSDRAGRGALTSASASHVLVNNCCSVVAVLPGIGDYKDDSDDSVSTSTSSDDELDDLVYPKVKVATKRGAGEGGEDNG